MNNQEITLILRKIAISYQILNENRFKILAYEKAADIIDNLTRSLQDMWKEGDLEKDSGLGKTIAGHLEELFRTGKVKHFESVLAKIPPSIFVLLNVPGLGPKKAHRLITAFGLNDPQTVIQGVKKAAEGHKIALLEGFGEKSEQDILAGIGLFEKGAIKEKRILLSEAIETADEISKHLASCTVVKKVDILGSLRRRAPTIGDIDLAVATEKPEQAIDHFLTYPHEKLIERGPTGASILLHNGRQVDLRVLDPASYGSMLQYFTGSKKHNVALRNLALSHNKSLSEYGVKDLATGIVKKYDSEEKFYRAVGIPFISPELREDRGEIQAAKKNTLPVLVEETDIKGDLHIHTDYDLQSSHDIGTSSLKEYLKKAEKMKYEYIGISDHNPRQSGHSENYIINIMKNRKDYYEQQYYSYNMSTKSRVQIVVMLEADITPDGNVALPEKAFDHVDGIIVSVHSSFTQDKTSMTQRVVKALISHPKIRIFGHPTGRLLGKREGYDLDWDLIYEVCRENDIAIEVNANPYRLDLPDIRIKEAIRKNVKLVINTDSHNVDSLELMSFGVSTARRGWATRHDIINTLGYNDFITWFKRTVSR